MALDKLLYLQGVGASYVDYCGDIQCHSMADRMGILACMLAQCEQPRFDLSDLSATEFSRVNREAMTARIQALDADPWLHPLAVFQFACVDEPHFSVSLPKGRLEHLVVVITTEAGDVIELTLPPESLLCTGDYYVDGRVLYRYRVDISAYLGQQPALTVGYHDLSVRALWLPQDGVAASDSEVSRGTWLLAPRLARQLGSTDRPWGVSISLYSLRSESQWGIGDFADLEALIDWLASTRCDFIQLNPLHALGDPFDMDTPAISPYSPSDRRRLNPLYIAPHKVAEAPQIQSILAQHAVTQERLNHDNWLDYPQLTQVKYTLFIALYRVFRRDCLGRDGQRERDYHQFLASEGQSLRAFAAQEAAGHPLCLAEGERAVFADPEFHLYLQFVAHEQLLACQQLAQDTGMSIGLIGDLAVGVKAGGAEVMQQPDYYCRQASIGAPADDFAPDGQNWGLTPPDPIAMGETGFEHFIGLIRSNMRYYGGLRIDHVMAFLRLWWWPSATDRGEGAYVYYPLDTLLAIVRTESMRQQCVVIGEDLGIVPDEVRSKLADSGIYGNELFYFAKHSQGFNSPARHKAHSMMMLANHDVPTLLAWWSSSDLHLRRQFGLLSSDEQLGCALSQRDEERRELLAWLKQLGETVEVDADYRVLLKAWIKCAAKSRSSLFSVQLADLSCERHGVNIPGTWQEYANWQRRLPYTLTHLQRSPDINGLLHLIAKERSCKHSA